MESRTPDIDELLAERSWLLALCRGLVRDEPSAEDLVQGTLLAGIKSGFPKERIRPWLSRVARNLAFQKAREEARRRNREREVSRSEVGVDLDDLVSRAETTRSIIEAVLRLEEPYKTAVLSRFLDGLSPNAIAKRMEATPSTVRSWISRGLGRVRTDLDRRSPRWRACALTLIASGEGVRWAWVGAALIALLVVGGVTLRLTTMTSPLPAGKPRTIESAQRDAASSASPVIPDAGERREVLPSSEPRISVRASSLEDLRVTLVYDRDGDRCENLDVDEGGVFSLPQDPEESPRYLHVMAQGSEAFSTYFIRASSGFVSEIDLEPGTSLALNVTWGDGSLATGVALRLYPVHQRDWGLVIPWLGPAEWGVTDSSGYVEFVGLPFDTIVEVRPREEDSVISRPVVYCDSSARTTSHIVLERSATMVVVIGEDSLQRKLRVQHLLGKPKTIDIIEGRAEVAGLRPGETYALSLVGDGDPVDLGEVLVEGLHTIHHAVVPDAVIPNDDQKEIP